MRAFGVEPEECDRRPFVAYPESARTNAHQLLREANLTPNDPFFIVCPGSVWPTKRWTAAGYAELIRQLTGRYGKVLICGGPDDAPVAQAVHEQSRGAGVNLVGHADLQTFMALVDHAQVVISNDSAPMHIAVARNAPVVAVFCATTPSLGYGPYSERSTVVEKADLSCRPCSRHGTMTCPRGTDECMRSLTVHEVLAGVDRLLSSSGQNATPSL
jgi:heptosyltransferase-2